MMAVPRVNFWYIKSSCNPVDYDGKHLIHIFLYIYSIIWPLKSVKNGNTQNVIINSKIKDHEFVQILYLYIIYIGRNG